MFTSNQHELEEWGNDIFNLIGKSEWYIWYKYLVDEQNGTSYHFFNNAFVHIDDSSGISALQILFRFQI